MRSGIQQVTIVTSNTHMTLYIIFSVVFKDPSVDEGGAQVYTRTIIPQTTRTMEFSVTYYLE